jgi:hypothetical protein
VSYQKTTIEIDRDQLEQARAVLRTHGIKDTVNAALRDVNRRARLREAAALVRAGGLPIVHPDELTELRRPRF